MDTVVEKLFDKLSFKTETLWMEKWTEIEKIQLFAFFVRGYGLSRIEFPGEEQFHTDPKQYAFLKESFEIHYNEFFQKEKPPGDEPDGLTDVT